MTDPRYPIGKFTFDGTLTTDQKKQYLNDIEQTPAHLRAAVAGLSDQQLNTPYREGGWTVRQVARPTGPAPHRPVSAVGRPAAGSRR